MHFKTTLLDKKYKLYNMIMCWITYLLIILLLWYILTRIGTHIIFRPQRTCWPLHMPFQSVQAGPLCGVYLPAHGTYPTLLFFHGRAGNISHFESFAQTYAPLGYGILLFDYRGFGQSIGTPSQQHLQQDAQTVLSYAVKELHIPPQQLVIYGHSLGNAAALYAAQFGKSLSLKALILQSPFLSTPDMAASWQTKGYFPHKLNYRLVRTLVIPFLWRNRFDNTRLTVGLNLPVLLCSSKADKTLPWQQSAKLADGIVKVQRFLANTGGHDEFAWAATAVDQFLKQLPSSASPSL